MLWRDGRVQEGTTAPFDHVDRGLTLGDGLFDTALSIGGRIAFEADHVDRLVASADGLGIPADPDTVRSAMREIAERGPRLAIRTTLTRGAGPRGLKPPDLPRATLFVTAAPTGRAIAFAPLRLRPTAIARNDTSPAARIKTLGYLDAVLAAGEAARAGFDEALFCNTRGAVACAGTGNVFCVMPPPSRAQRSDPGQRDDSDDGAAGLLRSTRHDGEGPLTLLTPPLTDGVLPGITRGQLLALAPACGLTVEERSLTPEDLRGAQAVFVTNSLRLLAPVTAVGETAYDSAGHPAFPALREAVRGAVARACGVPPEEVA
ncbi:aminotransferase class IV [Methylobacterium aerolatum]|uniref:Probable branched-chain-amino-acid aminotransferase n=1 Tax=Methylobacterium aerolatum TaxID=418708 RepID=A0ABU0HZY0_9HYPH|nr:aminotransferase class IV [Methylobacterium aerolatum]MDQ0447891.1 branched-chain amino acid aminotransferase [Methylobacterium aerolatum]GJD34402.1 D-alanine aminotransferase [Methylobacterium aerolatum]